MLGSTNQGDGKIYDTRYSGKRMTEDFLISVIVPVYNTAEYLNRCVASIQEQTYQNLEIILVDDGSSDKSLDICRELELQDSRIIVIHKDNGGANSARKAALSIARGKYVGFVDSDDWIASDMYQELMHIIIQSQADIVSSGFTGVFEDGRRVIFHDALEEGVYEGQKLQDEFYSRMLYNGNFGDQGLFSSIWSKIFKRTVITKAYADIDERIFFGEDACVFFPACLEAKRIVITYNVWYSYVMRNDSVSHKPDVGLIMNSFYLYHYLKKLFSQYNYKDILLSQLNMYLVYLEYTNLQKMYQIDLFQYGEYYLPLHNLWWKCVIIYGAGKVGKSFYRQLVREKSIEIVKWVDSDYVRINENNGNGKLSSPQEIVAQEYDYVIIAVQEHGIAIEIERRLLELGVKKQKIVWYETKSRFPFEEN